MAEDRCTESYGFLPCSDDLGGSISLMVIYGYILLQGANILSEGSEMLLQILNPGIIGGLVLPVLGALPDSLIIFVAGYGIEDPDKVAEEVDVGMGTLAGSTVMLLTIAYGGGILLGRCDRNPVTGHMKETKLTKQWDFVHTGVTVEAGMNINAIVMLMSTLFYLSVQIPAALGYHEESRAALIGSILCLIGLVAYAAFQVVSPSMQKRFMEAARVKAQRMEALSGLSTMAEQRFGSLVTHDGKVNIDVIEQLFDSFDNDSSGYIEFEELHGLMMGLELATTDSQLRDDTKRVMKEFDKDKGGAVSKEEFRQGIQKWVEEKLKNLKDENPNAALQATSEKKPEEEPLMDEEAQEEAEDEVDDDDEEGEFDPGSKQLSPTAIAIHAVLLLIGGSAVCGFFADPMVEAVATFAKTSGIPPFFVSFIITPLASNASELVSSLKFASRKRVKNISLTFGQVYGAVTMNNTMCLGVFLFVVYMNDLPWTYTAKVLGLIMPTIIVGAIGSTGRHFRSFWAFPFLLLYPLSILLVWALDRVWGTA